MDSARQVVAVHERERRRRDRFGDSERRAEALSERGLAGAHLPGQHDQIAPRASHGQCVGDRVGLDERTNPQLQHLSAQPFTADARARAPRHASADAADDLVADGSEPVGPVLGGNLLGALQPVLLSDQHDLVADSDRSPASAGPQSTIS